MKRFELVGFGVGLALAGCGVACGSDSRPAQPAELEAKQTEPWNLLIWVIDTARADHFGANGYARATTPRLDAIAAEGVRFRQAVSVAPRTWQSFSSILTGLYPTRHGVRYLYDHPLDPETETLATLLRDRGYRTRAFDTSPFLRDMTGGVGFDAQMHADSRLASLAGAREALDENLAKRLLASTEEDAGRPFFYFVRLSGPHWKYNRNEWTPLFAKCEDFDHSFNEGGYGSKAKIPGEGIDRAGLQRAFWGLEMDERTRQHMIDHYDAKLRFTDELIGRSHDELAQRGALARTVVVVTSDHGESFGEHGYWQHGPRVDDVAMRVPLILWLPESHEEHRAGLVIDDLVSLVDLAPTALELVGASPPADLDGTSLIPLLRGGRVPERWVYGEIGRSLLGQDPQRYLPGVAGKHRMIRTRDHKLVFVPRAGREGGGEYRLYDLRADPGETRDMAASQPAVVARLRRQLEQVLARELPERGNRAPTEAETERLRRLGYVD